ncbi:MAG: glycosyltransferase family 39 protein [Planctomycetota bacterium]
MKKRVLIACALAAAIALAINASVRRSVTTDEFGSIWLAGQNDPAFIIRKVLEADIHPPTPYLFLHYWGKVLGYGDLAMRLPSLLAVLFSLLVIRRLVGQLQPAQNKAPRMIALVLAMSAPVLWIQASSARYYALGTLAGLLSTSCYLSWIQRRGPGRWWAYVLTTVAAFHIQYLLAALLVIAQGLHFVLRGVRRAGPSALRRWLFAQAGVIALAAPVIVWTVLPLLTGERAALGNRAHEGLGGLAAFPIVLGGHVYATLTGGVPFPWDFWVTVPVILAFVGVLALDLRGRRIMFGADMLWLVILPFALLAFAVAVLLPVTGFFQGVLRAGHIAVLCWILVGYMVAEIERLAWRRLAAGCLIAASAYGLVVHCLNGASMTQTPPLKTMAHQILSKTPALASTVVFHPFEHGWGDALSRYLPAFRCVMATDEKAVTLSEVQNALAEGGRPSTVWIIERSRFTGSAANPADWLTANGFAEAEATGFQEQRAFDLRVKDALKRIPQLHYAPAPSQRFIWTLRRFDRAG